ncbi:MAG: hypothetical protein SOT80_11050 [Candidatus Pseudoruminococcus sp.]|uniref:hypothetical protein n=1 Tax=Candidatus Pseudoruminococcus sp. TaxID=3101048 RepID=UPI002A78F597|nr:hypothetical protein [Candidatus Pseudoruminococcus sp.]
METEKSDPALRKSMNQFRRTIFILIAIVILSAIIATSILFLKINSLNSEPFFKVISASKNTFTAYSARIDATLENAFEDRLSTLTGKYEVNPDKKKLTAEFDIISKPIKNTSKKEDKIDIQINCTDNGGKILYKQNNKTESIDISKENAEYFFALFSETKDFSITNFNNDWQGLINKIGWQDYVNANEIENSLINIYNILSSDDGKAKILGLSTENTENGDIINFAINPYLTADCILTNSRTVFKRDEDYNYYKKLVDDNKSTLDSLVINFDITISNEGFLKEISADNLGIKLNLKISDIKS